MGPAETRGEAMTNGEVLAMTRNEIIQRLRKGLKAKTGKSWSVTGGRGTSYGWIEIASPPRRRTEDFGRMTDQDREELGKAFGLPPVHSQGISIPSQTDFQRYYLELLEEGRTDVQPRADWD